MLVIGLAACTGSDGPPGPLADGFGVVVYTASRAIAGAGVRFDIGATSIDATTAEDGRVQIDGFDWDDGPATLAVVAEDRVWSAVGLDEAMLVRLGTWRGDLGVEFPDAPGPADTVTLSGQVAGVPPDDEVFVVVHPFVLSGDATLGFSVPVPVGRAFDVLGIAWRQTGSSPDGFTNAVDGMVVVPMDALEQDATVTLDFSAPDASIPFAHRLAIPDDSFFSRSEAFVTPVAADTSWRVQYGMPTRVSVSEGVFEGRYVPLATVAEPSTMYRFDAGGRSSVIYADGWPLADGDLPFAFVVPPVFEPHGLDGEFEWTSAGVGQQILRLSTEAGGVRWLQVLPADVSSTTLAPLPGDRDPADLFGSAAILAELESSELQDGAAAVAYSAEFLR